MLFVALFKTGQLLEEQEWGDTPSMARILAIRLLEAAQADKVEVRNEKGEIIFHHSTL